MHTCMQGIMASDCKNAYMYYIQSEQSKWQTNNASNLWQRWLANNAIKSGRCNPQNDIMAKIGTMQAIIGKIAGILLYNNYYK